MGWLMYKEQLSLRDALRTAQAKREVIDPYGYLIQLLGVLERGLQNSSGIANGSNVRPAESAEFKGEAQPRLMASCWEGEEEEIEETESEGRTKDTLAGTPTPRNWDDDTDEEEE